MLTRQEDRPGYYMCIGHDSATKLYKTDVVYAMDRNGEGIKCVHLNIKCKIPKGTRVYPVTDDPHRVYISNDIHLIKDIETNRVYSYECNPSSSNEVYYYIEFPASLHKYLGFLVYRKSCFKQL